MLNWGLGKAVAGRDVNVVKVVSQMLNWGLGNTVAGRDVIVVIKSILPHMIDCMLLLLLFI